MLHKPEESTGRGACSPEGGVGWGHSLMWPIRGRAAAGQDMVFGLCPEQGI